jgi:predicted Zn-dependent protease
MTAIQLKQEFFQEFSSITGDESFWRDAIEALRRLVKVRLSSSDNPKVEDNQSKKRKVKDLSPEEKKAFLQRVYQKSRNDNPELYAMFDRMKFTDEDINDPDERVQYILSK